MPAALATELAEHVLDCGVDVAISAGMDVDHGTVQPLEKLFGDATAITGRPDFHQFGRHPLGPLHPARGRSGAAVGGFLAALDRRVWWWVRAACRTTPGADAEDRRPTALDRIVHGTPMTPEQRRARQDSVAAAARGIRRRWRWLPTAESGWDDAFLDLMDNGRLDELDNWTNSQVAGEGGQFRARGADLGCRVRRAGRPGSVPHRRPLLPGRTRLIAGFAVRTAVPTGAAR